MLLFFVITYAWTSFNADINLTGLHPALNIIHDERLTKSDQHRMGPYWFVQIDGGEWDKFVFAYFAWLVQRGTCTMVIISKMPVGHGHNDLDQKFGVISRHLKGAHGKPGHHMFSPQHFIEMVQDVIFANVAIKVVVAAWWAVLGFKKFLEPHITPNFQGHSQPVPEREPHFWKKLTPKRIAHTS